MQQQHSFPSCRLPAETRVIGYARVSPGPQQDITAQINYMRAFCEFHKLRLIHIYQDKFVSGGSMAGREQLVEMIKWCKQDKARTARAVLFFDVSRLARDMDDASQIRAFLRQYGYRVEFIFDVVPPGLEGRIVEVAMDYAAALERKKMRERVKVGHKDLRQLKGSDGKYLGIYQGRTPFGYLTERFDTGLAKHNGEPRIVTRLTGPDPELAPLILEAYRLKARGMTSRDIEAETNLFGGWPEFDGSDSYGKASHRYRYLFRLAIYMGDYWYNEKVYLDDGQMPPPDKEIKTIRRKNPLIDAYVVKHYYEVRQVYKDFVEAIVPRELWQEVQEVQKGGKKRRAPRTGTARYHLLSGVCHCAKCKARMYPTTRNITRNGKRYTYRHYECSQWTRLHACEFKRRIRQDRLDKAVIDALLGLLDAGFIIGLTDAVNEIILADSKSDNLELLKRDIADLERIRERSFTLYIRGDDYARTRYEQTVADLERKQQELARIETATPEPIYANEIDVKRTLDEVLASLEVGDIEAKKRAVTRVIKSVFVGEDDGFYVDIKLNLEEFVYTDAIRRSQDTLKEQNLIDLIPPLRIEIPTG